MASARAQAYLLATLLLAIVILGIAYGFTYVYHSYLRYGEKQYSVASFRSRITVLSQIMESCLADALVEAVEKDLSSSDNFINVIYTINSRENRHQLSPSDIERIKCHIFSKLVDKFSDRLTRSTRLSFAVTDRDFIGEVYSLYSSYCSTSCSSTEPCLVDDIDVSYREVSVEPAFPPIQGFSYGLIVSGSVGYREDTSEYTVTVAVGVDIVDAELYIGSTSIQDTYLYLDIRIWKGYMVNNQRILFIRDIVVKNVTIFRYDGSSLEQLPQNTYQITASPDNGEYKIKVNTPLNTILGTDTLYLVKIQQLNGVPIYIATFIKGKQ